MPLSERLAEVSDRVEVGHSSPARLHRRSIRNIEQFARQELRNERGTKCASGRGKKHAQDAKRRGQLFDCGRLKISAFI